MVVISAQRRRRHAVECLPMTARLPQTLLGGAAGGPPPRPSAIANLYIARGDARNDIVLGDPAARLRTESMLA